MTKLAIAKTIQEHAGIPANLAAKVTDHVLKDIVKTLKDDGGYTLPGFGTFSVQKIKSRKFVNPKTGQPIPSVRPRTKQTVRFKAALKLRREVS